MENNKVINVENQIIEKALQLLKDKSQILIGIDGRCASGKTTLAAGLKEKLSCEVIHMDDFFLRPDQRTKERLAIPGGNVDYERFSEEVINQLNARVDFCFRPYDCHTGSMKESVLIRRNTITVIEGSYSCHPQLWDCYDLHVFLDVDEVVQRERILARNGKQAAEIFACKWIPLEEAYFNAYKIKERCEIQAFFPC